VRAPRAGLSSSRRRSEGPRDARVTSQARAGVDAGCASGIEAIESGEAHAPELAHVAMHESTLGAWTLRSCHRYQGHITGSKRAEPSSAFRRSQCWETSQPSESGVRSFREGRLRPRATALRVVGLLVSTRASIARVATHLPPTRVRWRFWLASKASA
jgi:hypothetical protein